MIANPLDDEDFAFDPVPTDKENKFRDTFSKNLNNAIKRKDPENERMD